MPENLSMKATKPAILAFWLSVACLTPAITVPYARAQSSLSNYGKTVAVARADYLKPEEAIKQIERKYANKSLSKDDLALLVEIVQKYPQNSHAHLLLGNCCDSFGLPLQAIEQYKLAFTGAPNDVQSLLELVKALIRSGQVTAASNLLKQAMEKFPTDPQVLLWTGNTLLKEKRYNEAASLYEKALSTSKKPIVGLYSGLGSIHLQEDHYTKAYELAARDLSYDRKSPQANEVMGMTLYKVGKLERACPFLEIAFKNDPNNYETAFAYAQTLIWTARYTDAFLPAILALYNSNNFQKAKLAIKTLDVIVPHLSKRQIKDSIAVINRIPALRTSAEIHLKLVQICLDKNMADMALHESFVANKLNPKSSFVKYRLALILENYMHNYPLALQYMRQAQALDPDNSQIKQYLMRLEDRMTRLNSDWAWRMKDWLTKGRWPANYSS